MIGRVSFGLIGALALAGCATQMSAEDCASADWAGLGENDGRAGEARERFGERADRCGSFGVAADYEAYFAGRERGLRNYCTPESGYEAGRSGAPYRGVCPAGDEPEFLAEYNIGRRLYELTQAHQSAVSAYESALSAIDYSRDRIRRAREELRKDGLSDKERDKLRKRIDDERRDMERTERDLPRLAAEIDQALGRLEDYRAFLNRRY